MSHASKASMAHKKAQTEKSRQTAPARMSTTALIVALLLSITALVPSASYGQGTVAPSPVFQGWDGNGHPLVSGKLCSYVAGTTTPASTYTTSALNVANSNPVILNSAGRAVIFLRPGQSYKFALYTAGSDTTCNTGTLQWSVDNVSALPTSNVTVDVTGTAGESIASGQIVYLSDGSGGKNASQWYTADADFIYASTTPTVGVAVSAIASGATGSIRLEGLSDNLTGLTPGVDYYVSATAGGLTSTPPANIRYLGRAASTTALVTTPNPSPLLSATAYASIAQGRLTLSTGVPVTTADVLAATTVYFTPYLGDQVSLFESARWYTRTFAQLSIAVPATTNTNYDVFVYSNAGAATLELSAAWNSATQRFAAGPYASLLPTQDGVSVKSTDGTVIDTTRRYVGSFRTTAVSGQTEDSLVNRLVWNAQNRVPTLVYVSDTAATTYTYTIATWRQSRATATNQIRVLQGIASEPLALTFLSYSYNDVGLGVSINQGIGVDSITVPTRAALNYSVTANEINQVEVALSQVPAIGLHTYAMLEASQATGNTTFYGGNNGLTAGTSTANSLMQGLWTR